MNPEKKIDILNALACLKAMCASYKTCAVCPAYNESQCICSIKYSDPCDYELNTADNSIWRAFK